MGKRKRNSKAGKGKQRRVRRVREKDEAWGKDRDERQTGRK